MRRIDLINAAHNVQRALEESRVLSYVTPMLSDKADPEQVMLAFQKYSRFYDAFGEIEKEILDIFGISGLNDSKIWARLMTGEKSEFRDITRPIYRGGMFALEFLGKIVDMLKQDNIEYLDVDTHTMSVSSDEDGKMILTVIIPEKSKESSHPDRLVKVLESVRLFYETIAKMNSNDEGGLSVVAIDSGSDKSFDFLGVAQVVTAVKEIIIELWDRVVFYREKKLHERMELISKSLPIIEKINDLEKNDKMSKEQCEILRRNIYEAAKGFIAAGAVMPEFSQNNNFNPRVLMAPEPKLLAVSTSVRTRHENDSSAVSDEIEEEIGEEINRKEEGGLSKEEATLLKKLLAKEDKAKRVKRK